MRLLLLRVDRGRQSSSGRVLATRDQILREVPVCDREWVRERHPGLGVRCIRRGPFRAERAAVREDRALLRDQDLAQHDLGLGIGQELLRVG